MIERLYLKELVTFDEVALEFDDGLVVLSGPSGAGKSVLISTILSSFGYSPPSVAKICEVGVVRPKNMMVDTYHLEETITIKSLKKEKLRYFIDGQNISKKTLHGMFSPFVKYLSVRDKGGFDSATLISMIDIQLLQKDKSFRKLQKDYQKRYKNYKEKLDELNKIKDDEARLMELVDYAKYEIEKISSINPKIGEEESLLTTKQQLSRVDKIKDALVKAEEIFILEESVEEVYRLLDRDSSAFSDTMNQLRADFEETEHLADELKEIDVEEVLNRLSDLMTLQKRYGSIEEALEYKALKEQELERYQNIEQDKSMLISFLDMEYSELTILGSKISSLRQEESRVLEISLEGYLTSLKLPKVTFQFISKEIDMSGIDEVDVLLGSSTIATLSGGEFNRVRLALMATTIDIDETKQGVLILDEIDANVSGDESIAIANMIQKLSSVYQVFAISHQAHLSSKATQHILVTKVGNSSKAIVLDEKQRVSEIARIIAGENPTSEAMKFARKLRG
ncbi:MAG: DNA recombination protein RecN [Sulfurovum sp.]